MIGYFCDRCGKKIKPYGGIKIKWERGIVRFEARPRDADSEGSYDLCDECSSEFKGWIGNADGMDRNEAAGAE